MPNSAGTYYWPFSMQVILIIKSLAANPAYYSVNRILQFVMIQTRLLKF